MRVWRLLLRELRNNAGMLVGMGIAAAALDALSLRQSWDRGDVSAFARPMWSFFVIAVSMAAVLAHRTFIAEHQRGVWGWLSGLPIAPRSLLLTKLSFVVGVVVGVSLLRVGVHSVLGEPAWPEIAVRVAVRIAFMSAAIAATACAVALSGARALLLGTAAALTAPFLFSLFDLDVWDDGIFGLVLNGEAGRDDVGWPFAALGAAAAVVVAAALVHVAVAARAPTLSYFGEPPRRALVCVLACLSGAGLVIDNRPPADPGYSPAPERAIESGVVTVVSSQTPERGVERQAVVQRTFALLKRAAPERALPGATLEWRDAPPAASAVYGTDSRAFALVETDGTAFDLATTTARLTLWQGRKSRVYDTLPLVVAARVVPGGAPLTRIVVPRRIPCIDLDHWGAVVDEFGAGAAFVAAAVVADAVAVAGDAALDAALAAAMRGDDDADILGALGATCPKRPPPGPCPWLVVRPGVDVEAVAVVVSPLTGALRLRTRTALPNPGPVEVSVDVRSLVNAVFEQHDHDTYPAASLERGVLVGPSFASGSFVRARLKLTGRDDEGALQAYVRTAPERVP
jgi:hypothetical protein